MTKKIRVGIIGFGKTGKIRKKVIENNPDLLLECICDIIPPEPDDKVICKYFENYKDLLKSDVDAVFVCVPHTLTKQIVIDSLKNNLHVFAEKPPGICIDDVLEIESELTKHPGLKLKFGFNHRYYQHVQFLKKTVNSDRFGKLLWFRGIYGRTKNTGWRLDPKLGGRGIFISQGIHMLDIVLWLFGHYQNKDAFGIVGSTVSKYKNSSWFEDNVFILLESEQGVTGTLQSSCTTSKNTFNLWCQFEDGWVELKGVNTSTKSFDFPERIVYGVNDDSCYYGNPPYKQIMFEKDFSWKVEVDKFCASIRNKSKDYDCSIHEALLLMKMVDEIYVR